MDYSHGREETKHNHKLKCLYVEATNHGCNMQRGTKILNLQRESKGSTRTVDPQEKMLFFKPQTQDTDHIPNHEESTYLSAKEKIHMGPSMVHQ